MTADEIRLVLLDQREELAVPPPAGRWVRRDAERDLRRALTRPLVKVIMGPRRSGKSVLARLALEGQDFVYVNFDDERFISLTARDLQHVEAGFAALWPSARIVFMDEVQNVPGWELFVSRLQRRGYNLVVTGSNSKLLSKELATHLTGRYVAIELLPFSFGEVLRAESIAEPKSTKERERVALRLVRYAQEGGYPEMVLSGFTGAYLRELHDKIVSRDIAMRHRVKMPRTLKELSLYCFSNPATRLTYNSIERMFSFRSVHTAKNYLQYLDEAYLVFSVTPFAFKFREQVKQARKIYTVDNGLITALSTKVSGDRGALLENIVFQELRRRGLDIFTWAQPDGEVDFLVREDRRVRRLIQVCASLDTPTTIAREYGALFKASAATRCKDLVIVTFDGRSPPAAAIPEGPAVAVKAAWDFVLDAGSANGR